MEFTAREIEAIKLWLGSVWYADPWKELLDADWSDEEASETIHSIEEKLGLEG